VSSPQVDDGICSSYARLRFAFVRTGDGLKAVIVFIGDRPVITSPPLHKKAGGDGKEVGAASEQLRKKT